jgi:hypothetical protein
MQIYLAALLCLIASLPAAKAEVCSHQNDPVFYQINGYTIRHISFENPFNFFFLVRNRLDAIKTALPIKEGALFNTTDYDESFFIVRDAVKADSALGKDSPIKIVSTTGGLENCQEAAAGPHTVDVVYRTFSTDPIPAVQATPEQRQSMVDKPATTAASSTLIPKFQAVPQFSYDPALRGYGGIDLSLRLPARIIDRIDVSASGSSSSSAFYGGFHGSGRPDFKVLARLEYALAYRYNDAPALNLRLTKGVFSGNILACSRELVTSTGRTVFRYGASIEQGIQQTNSPGESSPYGALTLYGGIANTTRYSETSVSYGFSLGGPGLPNLNYVRNFGDVSYSRRFPSGTNRPWDVALRLTTGGIAGAGPILLNDRFFGGDTVSSLLPNSSWYLPAGPIVRSIPTNRLAGMGSGGTSFYSTNLTIGKVIKGWPIIPPEVENSAGFSEAVDFAENSAETWFADDYESASPAFKQLLDNVPPRFKADLDAAKAVLAKIGAAHPVDAVVKASLKKGDSLVTVATVLIATASDSTLRGADRAGRFRAWLTPASAFIRLTKVLAELEQLVPEAKPELENARQSLQDDLVSLSNQLKEIHAGPAHANAVTLAQKDMARPREIIDTLRHEVNRYSVSIIGLVDVGRLWPDPDGARLAFGGGGRLSLVNVNFNLGYAINPSPQPQLGQGRGALFLSITYTNLF